MKQFLTLMIGLVFSSVLWGQTIFTQNFESVWTIPSSLSPAWSGTTTPANNQWQQSSFTTGWTSATGAYSPLGANSTTASARFHTYDAASASTGEFISPTIDLSSYTAGTVYLSFYYINTSGTDVLNVFSSSDNGATWSAALAPSPIGVSASWTLKTITLPGNSATTKLKFIATSDYGTTDIGVDEIRVFFPVTPDAAPANFNVIASNPISMTIEWTDNSTNETAFRVYRSPDNITFTQFGSDISSTTSAGTGTNYSLNVTGLTQATTYYYKIAAVADAESSFLLGDYMTPAANPISGTKSIPGDYTSLTLAVADLNMNGVDPAGVSFNIASGYTESITAPISIDVSGVSGGPIVFQKNGTGANPVITRTDAGNYTTSTLGGQGDAIIVLNGADYVTIDGIDVVATNQNIEYGYLTNKPNATNGCQYVTIKNCNVTMTKGNSGYVVGIYVSNGPNAISSATGVTVTATSGINSNITIIGNTISNTFNPINVRGSSATGYYDANLIVGQSGSGNILKNFGASSAGSTYGVYLIYQLSPTVSYNNINNTNDGGVAHTSTLYGIFNSTSDAAGNCIYNNNTITLSNSATSATFWINDAILTASKTINNNTFGAGMFNSTTASYLITVSSTTNNFTITGNQTTGNITKTGAGVFYGIYNIGAATGGTANISTNNFSNITLTGASTFAGIYWSTATTQVMNIYSNTINNIYGGSSTMYGIYQGKGAAGSSVYNNTISNFTSNAEIDGIYIGLTTAPVSMNVYGNNIYNLNTSGANTVYGIYSTLGTLNKIYNNKIYGLQAYNASGSVYGIAIVGGTATSNNYVYNNFISQLYTPISSLAEAIRGISITSTSATSTIGVYYNSIYLDAVSSGTNFGTSGIYHTYSTTATTAALDMRNNIIANNSVSNGTGFTVAFRRNAATNLNNYSTTSNRNCFFAGNPNSLAPGSLIYYDGTNKDTTIASFKTRMSTRDALSVSELPPFMNIVTSPYNLKLSTSLATKCEGTAGAITTPIAITADYESDVRNASTPDIGADEGTFVSGESTLPNIVFTPLTITATPGARTLTAQIYDESLVPTTGTGLPVAYWRIFSGAWNAATATYVSGNTYTFSIGTGSVAGDKVEYFVVAQDAKTTPAVGSYPFIGATGFTASPPAASTPPTTILSYYISGGSPLSGTKTINNTLPTGSGNYNNFQDAFYDLNAYGVSGPVTFNVSDGQSWNISCGTNVFGLKLTAFGTSTNTITFQKSGSGANPVLNFTGTAGTADAGIWLNSSDYITFNGIDINDAGTSAANYIEYGLYLYGTASDGCSYNNFKNGVVDMNRNNVGATGIYVNGTLATSAAGSNNYNKFYNNTIKDSRFGYQIIGASAYKNIRNEIGNESSGTSKIQGLGSLTANSTVCGINANYQDTLYIYNTLMDTIYGSFGTYPTTVGMFVINSSNVQIYGNTVRKLTTSAADPVGLNFESGSGTTNAIYNNLFTEITALNSGNINTMRLYTGTSLTLDVYGNEIKGLVNNGVSTGTSNGIYCSYTSSTINIYKNKIHDFYNSANSGNIIYGLYLAGSTNTYNVYNNMIYDLRAPLSSGTAPAVSGIRSEASTCNIYYNTILLDYTSLNASNTSAAFYANASATVDIRNNIFDNKVNVTTGTRAAAFWYSSTTNTTIASSTNFNIYYAGTPGAKNNIFYDGTNARQTLSDYKTFMSNRDQSSYTENVAFVNSSSPYDVHVSTSIGTFAESTGQRITTPAITTDIDGVIRQGETGYAGTGTLPDIGADEGEFIANDIFMPAISFTALTNTSSTSSRVITATITDGSGVPTSGAGLPVLYWKKFFAGTYTPVTAAYVSGNQYTFTLSPVVTVDDSIYYYFAAQDNIGNVGTFPSVGSAGITSDPPAATTHPTSPYSYKILNSISGVYHVGTAQSAPYNSLTAAVNYLNSVEMTGPTTFILDDVLYNMAETFPITINQNAGAYATNTLTIKPNTGTSVTITGTNTTALLKLNGADYVIIDGSNSGGTDKNLTFYDSSLTSGSAILLSSLGNGLGATYNTIKNCNINMGSNAATTYGISIGGATAGTSGADNDNNTIQNNTISNAYIGIYAFGSAASKPGIMDTLNIIGNSLGASSSTVSLGYYGLSLSNGRGCNIAQNTVYNITSASTQPIGMYIQSGFVNSIITRNNINNVTTTNTGGWGAWGLHLGTANSASNLTVKNNIIYQIGGTGFTSITGSSPCGIYIPSGGGYNIWNNSISLTGNNNYAGNTITACIYVASGLSNIDIRNNILYNAMGHASAPTYTNTPYIIYNAGAATNFSNIDYNDYYTSGTGAPFTCYQGGAITTLAAWKTATTKDVNSLNIDPGFNSTSDLNLANLALNNVGVPIAGVTVDYYGITRGANPDLGAIEFTPPTDDAGVLAITSPSVSSPLGSVPIIVSLKNFGVDTLRSATIYFNVNGGTAGSYSWTGAIGNSQTATGINVGNLNLVNYNSTIKAWTALPNGNTDPKASNDTATASIIVCNPLSGNYTIGGTTPDYATFGNAVNALTLCGVGGPVTFNVRSGIYTERLILNQVVGASATNTITFQSESLDSTTVTLQNLTDATYNYVVRLNGADYIAFNKMTVKTTAASAGTYGQIFDIFNNAHHNTISNCVVIGTASTTSSSANVINSGSVASYDSLNVFKNNKISNGYAGIYWYGSSTTQEFGTRIEGNQIVDAYYAGIYAYYQDSLIIKNNTITKTGATAAFYAIYYNTGVRGGVISGNTINITSGAYAVYNIYVSGVINGLWVNDNSIQSSNSSTCYGIYTTSCNNGLQIRRNKLNISNTSTTYGIYPLSSTGTALTPNIIANNMYAHDGGTTTQYGLYLSGNSFTKVYNNSIALTGAVYTSAYTCYTSLSSTDVTIMNNIFYNGKTGYAFYGSATTAITTMDNNDFYSNGTNLAYWGGARTTLAALQTASGKDANSFSVDPGFTSLTFPANLHASSPIIDERATPFTEVNTDIDGEARSLTTPDIGADEYTTPNMTYTTSVVDQITGFAVKNTANNEIIRIKVTAGGGNSNKLTISKFTLNANGSTAANLSTNIDTVKVFYTGNSSTFSTSAGSLGYSVSPSVTDYDLTLTTSKEISYGDNYFWVTYNVKSTATDLDVIDAECTGITASDQTPSHIPTVTSPAGNVVIRGALNGIYTIDNLSATNVPAGTNYNNFTDAVNDLNNLGISGPVTFNVTAGQTFFAVPVSGQSYALPIITSGTSIRPIIFQKSGSGANPLLNICGTSGTSDIGLWIYGTDYLTWDGIDLGDTSTFANSFMERILYLQGPPTPGTDGCYHNTFKNFTITLNRTNTSNFGIQSSSTSATTVSGNNSYNTFLNLTIQKATRGIYLTGKTGFEDKSNSLSNIIIDSIGATGSTPYGLYMSYQDSASITNTRISALTGATIYGLYTSYCKNFTIQNDTIRNIYGATSTAYGIYPTYCEGNNLIKGNVIHTLAGAAGVNGLYRYYGAANNQITENLITGLTSTAGAVYGMISGYGTSNDYFFKNTFNNISNTGTGAYVVAGFATLGGVTTHNVYLYNNYIYDIKGVNSTSNVSGISLTGGNDRIYYNTVLLDYTAGASNISAAIYSTSTSMLDLRNNILANKVDATAGTRAVALWWATTDYTNLLSSTNNNLLYAGTPGVKNLIFYDGSNTDQTLLAYQTHTNRESNSISENPPFISSTSPYNLHLSGTTGAESNGQPIVGFNDDFDGNIRYGSAGYTGTSTVGSDIGADEFNGTAVYTCITPTPGNTVASSNGLCFGSSTTLSLQNDQIASGLTYKWQSSLDNVNYSDISGANTSSYTATPTVETYYKCVVTCASGPSTATSTPIQINFAAKITATVPGQRCGTGTVSLGATASAGSVNWYANASGGNKLGTGTAFTTPSISSNTTYYAAAETGTFGSVGEPNTSNPLFSAPNGQNTTTSAGIIFDVIDPNGVTISSIDIYPTAAIGSQISIGVFNGTSTTPIALYTALTTVTGTITSPVVQTLPVNFVIPAGTGYQMRQHSTPAPTALLNRYSMTTWPTYTLANELTMTGSITAGYYYYFFNWQVSTLCAGQRIPVLATVHANSNPTASTAISSANICPGGSQQLSANLTGVSPWSITVTDGTTPQVISGITSSPWTTTVNPSTTTTYSITNITDSFTCSNTSTAQTVVTVNSPTTSSTSVTACNSYVWNGTTYTTSGDKTFTTTNAANCDSVATLHLTINNSNTGTQNTTACNTYTWPANTTTYTTSGVYTATLQNVNNCDSVVTLNLTINNSNTGTQNTTACNTYTWPANTTTYTTSGVYTATLQNVNNCDSVVTLNLTINNSNTGTQNTTACNTYTWPANGSTYTASGVYTATLQNVNNCDSVVTLNLTINNSNTGTQNTTACNTYTWPANGSTYTASGVYTATLQNVNNCDSVVTLNLTINNSNSGSETQVACNTYTWNGTTYTTSGVYNKTLQNIKGCDSVATLNLTINNSNSGSETQVACNTYTWNGTTYTTSGVYNKTLQNIKGCDSVATLNLTINYSNSGSETQVACNTYTWNGTTYTTSGVYNKTLQNVKGCDSVATLNLTINYSNSGSESKVACNSFTWNGTTYTTSGVYNKTLQNIKGCDSVATLNLTINYSNTGNQSEIACNSYTWAANGQTYTTSGIYTTTLTNASGCDSLVTLDLVINYSNSGSETQVACNSFTWNGTIYTTSGVYNKTLQNVKGCDSIATLNLTINYSNSGSETQVACNTYTWNGTTYTTSGVYNKTLQNVYGCDSVATLNLTINYSTSGSETKTECNTYTWDGTTYTTSGDYVKHYTNSVGCDSTATLHLTINYSTSGSETKTECNTYTWDGTTYTTSGDYVKHYTNSVGCDSTATLHLTINYSNSGSETQVACNTFTWNGTTYTTSGVYNKTLQNVNGCDSAATLNLTINYSNSGSETQVACNTFTWNGTTYTTSGVYNKTLQNVLGCDSVATLNLTINYSNGSSQTETSCNTFTWASNGQTYTTSGVYTTTFQNVSSCDSVVTLNLTINNSPAMVISTPATLCNGASTDLTLPAVTSGSASGLTYTYFTDNVATIPYTTPSTAIAGTYYIKGTDANLCYTILPVTVSEYQNFVVGSITGNQTICYNTTPAQLTGVDPTGGNIPYTYQWQSSTDNINFSDITTGGTSLNYSPGALTSTTYYRLNQTSANACGMLTTNTVTINVNGNFVSGTISANQTICVGSPVNAVSVSTPAGGTGSYTYQWERNTFNGTVWSGWNDIGGANSASYQPVNPTSNREYRVKQTSSTCGTVTSAVTTLTVNPLPTVTLPSNFSILYNADTIIRSSVTGGSGTYNYEWTPAASIASSTTLDSITTSILTAATTYNVKVTDASTMCFKSNSVTVSMIGGPLSITLTQSDDTICKGASVQMNAIQSGGSAPYSFEWSSSQDAYATTFSTITNPIVTPTTTTTYRVILTDATQSDTAWSTIVVNQLPIVSFTGLNSSYCIDATASTLIGLPSGGDFDGNGWTGTNFNAAVAGVGNHTLTYVYEDANGCIDSVQHTTTVNDLPIVSFAGLNSIYCVNAPASTILPNQIGGTFSGNGISGATFTPATAGVGTHTITYAYTDANTCTNSTTQNVLVNNVSTGSETITACNTYTWSTNSTTYTTSGTYTHTLTNALGCDSVVTLNLTINYSNTGSETQIACDSMTWNGTTYYVSGLYTYHFTNAAGCDSTATLNLTINYSTSGSETQIACDSMTWNGTTYYVSGLYTYHFTNAAGCDSTTTLNLTINNSTSGSETQIACDSMTWNGTTYFVSGLYTYHFTNAAGCDSTATLNLTINNSTSGSETQIACDSMTWNGTTYYVSGLYTYHFTNAAGCDSTATLNLTINNSTSGSETQVACDSMTWNGTTYYTSGLYTYHFTNAAGCDSTATLNLTINNSTSGSETQIACDSMTWNGTTYYVSGLYTYHFTNAAGCDSTATLNLTINNSTSGSETQIACDSMTWNGTTYYVSGLYTYHFTNAAGCDSTATLNLTINNSNSGSESISACDSYTWQGTTYTISGTYTATLQNVNGCDSIATLNLTIVPSPVANAGSDVTITIGQSGATIGTPAVLGFTYLWTPSAGLSDSSLAQPIANPLDTTEYILTVSNGVCSVNDTMIVNVKSTFPINGTVTYDNTASTPLNGLKLYLRNSTGTIIDSTTTNSSGAYTFTPQLDGDYTVSVISNIAWGGVNSADALVIQRNFAGLLTTPLSGIRLRAGNTNNDVNGIVNSGDALLIKRRFATLISSFPSGDWTFNPDTIRVNGAAVTMNFKGLCFGDVNGTYIPTGAKGQASVEINKVGTMVVNTNTVDIPVKITHMMSTGAISMVLTYPVNALDVISVSSAADNISGLVYSIKNGKIYLAWSSLQPFNVQANDVVFSIKANVLSTSSSIDLGVSSISEFTDVDANVIPQVSLYYPELLMPNGISENTGNNISISNYPNPFTSSTTISYELQSEGSVFIGIYDVNGKLIRIATNENQTIGKHIIDLDGENLAEGLYHVQMIVTSDSKVLVGRSTMMKIK